MNKVSTRKTQIISISLPGEIKTQAMKFASRQDLTMSQLVKRALKNYIFESEWTEHQKNFEPAFRKLGIASDENIEKFFK